MECDVTKLEWKRDLEGDDYIEAVVEIKTTFRNGEFINYDADKELHLGRFSLEEIEEESK